jgi:hypothetical protein
VVTTIVIGIVAVFLAWLESSKKDKNGLMLSLFVIFVFLALRYDFGNDYMNYLNSFLEINQYRSLDFSAFVEPAYEFGWVFINRIFAPLGFFIMTAALAAFTCFVLYRFIKKYVPQEYYWFAIFLFVFQPYNMLVTSSAMRQEVAVMLFLLAIDFLYTKKFIHFLLMVFLATLFHTSAYFLLLLVLLNIVNWRITIPSIVAILIIFTIPLAFPEQLQSEFTSLIINYLSIYEIYTVDTLFESLGLGFLINVVIMLVVLYYAPEQKNENLLLFKIAIITYLIVSLDVSIHMIGRLNQYLQLVFMAIFPVVFLSIKKDFLRLSFIAIIVFFTLYQFHAFFQSDVWREYFIDYQTIFSAPSFK